MTDHTNPTDDHRSAITVDDAAIDALARQAGAEVRRPAPEGFGNGIRRARRRQQITQATVGGAGALVVIAIAVAAISGTGGDSSVVPATDPPRTTAIPVTTIGDPDGIPDGVYAPADEGFTLQDVFDPVTLKLLRTIPATLVPAEPASGGRSSSGEVLYTDPGAEADRDACNQTLAGDWAPGVDVSGLPERVTHLVISADGTTGAAISADCGATGDVTVVAFDPNDPATGRTVLQADGGAEAPRIDSLQLSDDGSYLLVATSPLPLTEGNASQIRVIDTADGSLVAAVGAEQSGDLPHTDCGLGFVSMGFAGPTTLAYAAICPEGIATVVHDITSGRSLDQVHTQFAGRTYETMPSASFTVDGSTLTDPAKAWYILCVDAENDTDKPCWIGHADEALRAVPTNGAPVARFEPFG